jgi:mono/diheme cytochrome c family protein
VEEEKEDPMQKDERDLLDVLKFELSFLEKGGYGRSPREAWRPVYIFEDSPTCMNYDCKDDPAPCSDCVLMQLVPPELRAGKMPCRQIPLNIAGENLDSLYRWGDQHDIEETLRNWLMATIGRLEALRKDSLPVGGEPLSTNAEGTKGIALQQNLHPKCANPACPTAFHWLEGGKFFRFRCDDAVIDSNPSVTESTGNLHGVKHFWLCERCSHVFTLVYTTDSGVVLKLLWVELPSTEARKELPAMARAICSLGTMFLAVFLIAGLAIGQEKQIKKEPIQPSNATSGAEMFKQYCAVCHGKDGKGDGPAASDLKTAPADLTTLAKRNGGKFPADHVMNVLRNGVKAPAHGTSVMPTWGPLFRAVSSQDQAIVNMRISNLTNYLKSLQEK